jgi:hypothetical protein
MTDAAGVRSSVRAPGRTVNIVGDQNGITRR